MTQVVSRFAPSPTGRLHLGHAYSALLAHDFARERGGRFLLRMEDIDPVRSKAEFVRGIEEDLAWLGLGWDGEAVLQSRRMAHYGAALRRLEGMGLVYACHCTRSEIAAEIAASGAAPHGPDGPIYPGICRRRTVDPRRDYRESPYALRLDTAKATAFAGPLRWFDGENSVVAAPEAFGDIVLARKDAATSYHLAVTVDDAAQGVTDVVRGADLFAATHVHRLLQALLGLPSPRYHHHTLLAGADGRRLAKRHGAPTLASLREAGADPKALAAALRTGQMPSGYSTLSA